MQSVAAQIATVCVGLRRGLGRQPPALSLRRINLRTAQRDRGLTCRAASVSGGSRRALNNRCGAALAIRSPPHQSWVAIAVVASRSKTFRFSAQSCQNSSRRSPRSHTPRTHPHRREPSGRPLASQHARIRFSEATGGRHSCATMPLGSRPSICSWFVQSPSNCSMAWSFFVTRRRLVSISVTNNPTAEWIAAQVTDAFPWDEAPRHLIRDRDGAFGPAYTRRIRAMEIRDHPTAPRSPWQNGPIERLIGPIRHESLDHLIVFGEAHCTVFPRRFMAMAITASFRASSTLRARRECRPIWVKG